MNLCIHMYMRYVSLDSTTSVPPMPSKDLGSYIESSACEQSATGSNSTAFETRFVLGEVQLFAFSFTCIETDFCAVSSCTYCVSCLVSAFCVPTCVALSVAGVNSSLLHTSERLVQ